MEMKNRIILSTLAIGFLFLFILSINSVSAEFWICLDKGEQIDYCNNYKPSYTCSSSSGCQKCMSVYRPDENCYIHGVWGNCVAEGQQCSSIGENGTEVDSTLPVINFTSPLENGLYVKRAVPLIFTVSERADVFYTDLDDGRGRWTRVCQDCTSYGNSRSFDEGINNIQFRIVDMAENEDYKNISFFVDSKKPKITKTEPRRGFANSDFYVQFMETNPSSLIITYGNLITGFRNANVDLNSCVIDRTRTNCDISVDLNDYDGEQIDYFFNITDIAGNYHESKANTLEVDNTIPVINAMNYTQDGNRVTFNFNITEKNFDVIEYMDTSESRPRWRTMCSRLKDDGTCSKRITFRDGIHDLSIQVVDGAGNIVGRNEIITVI